LVCEVPVHVRGGVGAQWLGGLGDLAGFPDRHPAGGGDRPELREAVAELDRVAEVGPPGVGGHAEGEGEVGDAELGDQGCAGSGDGELAFGAVDGRGAVVQGLDGVDDRPLDGELELVDLDLGGDLVVGVERGQHLVRGVHRLPGTGGVLAFAHGSTQALATDNGMLRTPWLTGIWTLS
jgi:hypothetical protein